MHGGGHLLFNNLDICNKGCDWLESYMMYVSPEGGSTGESYHHDMGLICSYLTKESKFL